MDVGLIYTGIVLMLNPKELFNILVPLVLSETLVGQCSKDCGPSHG